MNSSLFALQNQAGSGGGCCQGLCCPVIVRVVCKSKTIECNRFLTGRKEGYEALSAEKRKTITIDGPAGAGKSTIGKLLAERLLYNYLDTGAIYRALALRVTELGIDKDDEQQIGDLAENISIRMCRIGPDVHIYMNETDVTAAIRTPEIGMLASSISAQPGVRKALLSIQRELGTNGGIVADGRDMGTVVFPRADFKFYLDADESERSKRRYMELLNKDVKTHLGDVHEEMAKRDKQDMERKASPLKPAEDAHIIDSTKMSIHEVVEKMLSIINPEKILR